MTFVVDVVDATDEEEIGKDVDELVLVLAT